MQAIQTIMPEKVRAWNMTLSQVLTQKVPKNTMDCQIPPDFWCADSAITNDCYTDVGCADYFRLIYGKPIHIRVLYRSGSDSWQKYLNNYLRPNFLKPNALTRENKGKFILEIEPLGNTIEENCDVNCQKQIAFEV